MSNYKIIYYILLNFSVMLNYNEHYFKIDKISMTFYLFAKLVNTFLSMKVRLLGSRLLFVVVDVDSID